MEIKLQGFRTGWLQTSFAVGTVHLPLAAHVHGFDSGDDDSCTPKRLEAQHRPGDPLDGPVVLFDDVVEVFALAHQAIDAGVSLNAINGCCVGATLVDSDLLWHILKVDSTFEKSSGSNQIALGSQQEVHCIASAKNTSQVTIFYLVTRLHAKCGLGGH